MEICQCIGLLPAVRAPVEGRRGVESEATASALTGKLGDASRYCKRSGRHNDREGVRMPRPGRAATAESARKN
jgi:hypothetical protein